MTTPPDAAGPTDHSSRDELASAYLDGATTAEENALVERDVDLLRRVEELASLRDRLQTGPQPTAQADAHLAAALAAFETAMAGGDDATPATVTDLSSRRRWHERLPVAAVAAAVAVVALAAGLIGTVGRGPSTTDDTATAALEDQGEEIGAAGGIFESDADSADDADLGLSPSAGAATGGSAVPVFADAEGLAAYLRERVASSDQPTDDTGETGDTGDTGGDGGAPTGGGNAGDPTPEQGAADGVSRASDPCDAVGVLAIDPGAVLVIEAVVVAGVPGTAVAFTDPDGVDQLGFVADETCDVRERRPL